MQHIPKAGEERGHKPLRCKRQLTPENGPTRNFSVSRSREPALQNLSTYYGCFGGDYVATTARSITPLPTVCKSAPPKHALCEPLFDHAWMSPVLT